MRRTGRLPPPPGSGEGTKKLATHTQAATRRLYTTRATNRFDSRAFACNQPHCSMLHNHRRRWGRRRWWAEHLRSGLFRAALGLWRRRGLARGRPEALRSFLRRRRVVVVVGRRLWPERAGVQRLEHRGGQPPRRPAPSTGAGTGGLKDGARESQPRSSTRASVSSLRLCITSGASGARRAVRSDAARAATLQVSDLHQQQRQRRHQPMTTTMTTTTTTTTPTTTTTTSTAASKAT